MRDPSLKENPFLAEYDEWDLWCYKNVIDYDDPAVAEYAEGKHPDWVALDGGIDSNGWLVPQSASLEEAMEYLLGYYPRYGGSGDGCAASLTAVGPMDEETKTALLEMRSRVRASYVLPVPKWLADAPPTVARFIPDGNFALKGEPGSGISLDNAFFGLYSAPPGEDEAWHLYSPEGELLDTGEPGENWWQLYFKDFAERTGFDPVADAEAIYEYGGIISAYDPESYENLFAYTYKGEELDSMYEPRPETDPRDHISLYGPEIPLIHAYQREVEPRLPCGVGIGATSLEDLDQSQIIATGNSPTEWNILYLNVKALDDPANPYAGLYEEWDTWIYDNHLTLVTDHDANAHLPDDPHSGGFALINWVINTLEVEDAWQVSDFYLLVDDQGWLIPHRVGQELEYGWQIPELSTPAKDAAKRSYCGFRLQSAGVMPEELSHAYHAVLYQLQAPGLPEIPDWLIDNPPFSVRFLPTGEYVTYGELGTVNDDSYDLPSVLYSATGEEISRAPSGSEWWETTFPGYRQALADLGGEDEFMAHEWQGIIQLMEMGSHDGKATAVYSYTGVELEHPEFVEMGMYFEEFPGKFLAQMREAQLAKQ